jgi:hypothetical protein
MNEDAPQPEEEKPRYLLPDGCKELIDALPHQTPIKKVMFVFDQDGNALGAPQEIPEPESVPRGLSALANYVSRLVTSSNPFASTSLSILAANDEWGFVLVRYDARTQLLFSVPVCGSSSLEHSVRVLFASHEITPARDYLSTNDTIRHIDYLLPPSVDAVTTLCRKLLTDCLEVQPDETLHFLLHQMA